MEFRPHKFTRDARAFICYKRRLVLVPYGQRTKDSVMIASGKRHASVADRNTGPTHELHDLDAQWADIDVRRAYTAVVNIA